MTNEIKIISLDLDGVLFDGSSATFKIAQQVGLGDQYIELFRKISQENLSLRESAIEGAKIWKGILIDQSYESLVDTLPLMVGAEETVSTLQKRGYEVGCISSGVSQFFMTPLTKRLKLDFAYSNVLGSENGSHNGLVEYIMGGPEKAQTILNYVRKNRLTQRNTASVGNGINDIELFKVSAFSIAFNPVDPVVSKFASATVHSKDLRSILHFFE